MTYFERNKEMSFGPNLLTMKSTHILSDFVQMGDQKYLPLIFPSLVTCLLTKTRGVQDFFEEDKEKKWINIPIPPTFYDSFRVSKVGNFTTGVGKVTNFIFTQLQKTQKLFQDQWTLELIEPTSKLLIGLIDLKLRTILPSYAKCFRTYKPKV